MSTSYLEVVNEVLREVNVTELTSASFTNAKAIQKHVKNAVNRAYLDINNPEHEWPWLSVTTSQNDFFGNVIVETVAGQRWYTLNESRSDLNDDYHVDWENFDLTEEGVAGKSAPYTNRRLKFTAIEQWQRFHKESEDRDKGDTQQYGVPIRVIRHPNGYQFGLSPIPKGVYRIYFYAWSRPATLTADTDAFILPDQYIPVLVARARYYAWQHKEQPQQAALALEDYKKGLRGMREKEIEASPGFFVDDRIRLV